MSRQFLSAIFCTLILSSVAHAQTAVDYQRDIRPLLSNRCYKCHGPAKQEGSLRLDLREKAIARKAIVPGQPEKSRLIKMLNGPDDDRMPPAEAAPRLTPAQVTLLTRWIEKGAPYTPHWAFVKPRQTPPPTVRQLDWPRNPIDRFILARLEKEGLKPSPEADRPTLIRRLSLDLLGLLPSPQEVDEFVTDTNPDAYEKLVDRLLASPHYGERQARHWLDLARYADSNGYTIDGKRSIWPYRDWVIAAFNRDLPFDLFTRDQLAGDLLPQPTRAQLVATGFQRNTPFNEEGGTNYEQFRVERTVDRTNTTGTVWLGLTVGCAQCHTHKYDPISHNEYYQLYAFFNSVDEPSLPLPRPEQQARRKSLEAELAAAKKATQPAITMTPEALQKYLADLDKEVNGGWLVCYPKAVTSEQGATLRALEDGSVLAGGNVGASDTYVVESVAPGTGRVTAIRLEALTDASLPQRGPGRAGNGNFVLSQFTFETDGAPRRFRKALADHSQDGHDVSDVLKGDLSHGWAVNASNPKERNVGRQAHFILEKPCEVREGQTFNFRLRFSQKPAGYPLGRFRISMTFAGDRLLELPLTVQRIALMERGQRTASDMETLRQALEKRPPASDLAIKLQKEIKALDAKVDTTMILRPTAKARSTQVQKRGNFLDLGDAVEPGTFAALPSLGATDKVATRLDLARWLCSPDNPLTARVTVNRLWQQYFGKGLVETENDFGMQGALPTHPELLDWLAVEFQRQGCSMKQVHRLIVTSATYRQSSKARADLRGVDPYNKLLGRQHRLRLEAEIIRDAALSASGLLTRKVGGPGVYPPQPAALFSFTQTNHTWPESKGPDRYRRGMYTFIWRQSQHPLLATFDAPDAQSACTCRNRSNTPLQALHLANDPTFLEFAKALGDRVQREGPSDDGGRVDLMFKLCFGRLPGTAERERVIGYLKQQRGVDPDRAWTMVGRVLMNLDEFITRE